MRYLLLSLDAAGNWPPERTLIRALVDRGHEVHVISDAGHERDIVAAGGEYVSYRCAASGILGDGQPVEQAPQISKLERIFRTILLNADFGDELAGAIERVEPEVLLVDQMLWSASPWRNVPACRPRSSGTRCSPPGARCANYLRLPRSS